MGRKCLGAIVIILLLILCIIPNSSATDANVTVNLEYNNYIYEMKTDDTRRLVFNGTVTCYMDGLGKNVQYVDVDLIMGDPEGWIKGGGPYSYRFKTNGSYDFTLDILIPIDTPNRTKNTINVNVYWEATHHPSSQIKTSGYGNFDEINITVFRYYSTDNYWGSNKESKEDPSWLELNYQFVIGVFLLILPIIIGGIYFYKKE